MLIHPIVVWASVAFISSVSLNDITQQTCVSNSYYLCELKTGLQCSGQVRAQFPHNRCLVTSGGFVCCSPSTSFCLFGSQATQMPIISISAYMMLFSSSSTNQWQHDCTLKYHIYFWLQLHTVYLSLSFVTFYTFLMSNLVLFPWWYNVSMLDHYPETERVYATTEIISPSTSHCRVKH